ncbi:3-hydroxyacyl-CoA dehydrogenase family protein [Streptomyces sp. NBC_00076]|uniref:3-hydroxyacyl-CoA dehydrogenase family protein n=1 Tax=Streptomyces sp. NBC_00076 TaxID=2975642 RepID=UPI00324F2708
MSDSKRTVGVLGAGAIGSTVCADLVLHGFGVVLVDVDPSALERALDTVAQAARFGPMLRPALPRVDPDDALASVVVSEDLADLDACEFVVENVSERWEVKEQVYRALDKVLPPGVGIGVNTSSIGIGRLAATTGRPELVVGVHFMNPSHLTDTVEVMRGAQTSEECMAYVRGLLGALGKEAVVVGDFPGFVSNRISHLFFNEAARLIEDEGLDPTVVDTIFKKCFGHRMGPLETIDLIGVDTVALTLDSLYDSYQDPRFRASGLLRSLMAEGRLGRKTGAGFYDYGGAPHGDGGAPEGSSGTSHDSTAPATDTRKKA